MTEETAQCRHCRKKLTGKPYYTGNKHAVDPVTRKQAKICYYGDFVCSEACDRRACAELEDSMPGHGYGSSKKYGLSREAKNRIASNWDGEG